MFLKQEKFRTPQNLQKSSRSDWKRKQILTLVLSPWKEKEKLNKLINILINNNLNDYLLKNILSLIKNNSINNVNDLIQIFIEKSWSDNTWLENLSLFIYWLIDLWNFEISKHKNKFKLLLIKLFQNCMNHSFWWYYSLPCFVNTLLEHKIFSKEEIQSILNEEYKKCINNILYNTQNLITLLVILYNNELFDKKLVWYYLNILLIKQFETWNFYLSELHLFFEDNLHPNSNSKDIKNTLKKLSNIWLLAEEQRLEFTNKLND